MSDRMACFTKHQNLDGELERVCTFSSQRWWCLSEGSRGRITVILMWRKRCPFSKVLPVPFNNLKKEKKKLRMLQGSQRLLKSLTWPMRCVADVFHLDNMSKSCPPNCLRGDKADPEHKARGVEEVLCAQRSAIILKLM